MHTTTVRFGNDTWIDLKDAADLAGVATAQFIREATIARLGGAQLVDVRERLHLVELQVAQLQRAVRTGR